MPRSQPKSGAALRYERQMREAKAALAAQAAQVRALRGPRAAAGGEANIGEAIPEPDQSLKAATCEVAQNRKLTRNACLEGAEKRDFLQTPTSAAKPQHPIGCWPIIDLRDGQCRFPCTPHTARPNQHLFCGQPVAWSRNVPTSWCRDHLPIVCGAPGRHAGGASLADAAAGG